MSDISTALVADGLVGRLHRPGSTSITFLSGNELANSTFLDFASYRITSETAVEAAYGLDPGQVRNYDGNTDGGINVAIILDRVQDPTALLASDWGTRQQTLETLNARNTLWSTYGADQDLFRIH